MAPRRLPPYTAEEATDDRSGVRGRDSDPPPTARSHTGHTGRPPASERAVAVEVVAPASARAATSGAQPPAWEVPALSRRSSGTWEPLVSGAAGARAGRLERLLVLGELAARTLDWNDPRRRLLEMAMMRRDAALLENVLRGIDETGRRGTSG